VGPQGHRARRPRDPAVPRRLPQMTEPVATPIDASVATGRSLPTGDGQAHAAASRPGASNRRVRPNLTSRKEVDRSKIGTSPPARTLDTVSKAHQHRVAAVDEEIHGEPEERRGGTGAEILHARADGRGQRDLQTVARAPDRGTGGRNRLYRNLRISESAFRVSAASRRGRHQRRGRT
jgi:hypothetical protein